MSAAAVRPSLTILWAGLIGAETVTQLAFKAGSAALAGRAFGLGFIIAALSSALVWLAIAGYAATFVVWMMILQRMDLSRAFPLTGLVYVCVPFMAWFGFGEAVSAVQCAGIACIIGGVVLLGRE